jgi:hypothetical protein
MSIPDVRSYTVPAIGHGMGIMLGALHLQSFLTETQV